jgi:tetratricopeptide (TPR) repeat protein
MSDPVTEALTLHGQRVAITGRLATMPRAQAIRFVREQDGVWCPTVNRTTTLLALGQEGWPLQADGRLTTKLRRARALGQRIEVVSENSFFDRLGVEAPGGPLRRVSLAKLSELLKIPGHRIRRWIEWGLVQVSETVEGIPHFDFRQVTWVRTLCDCLKSGVPIAQIRRSLHQLRGWLPEAGESLTQLAVLERDGRLMVRIQEELVEPSGQRTLPFEDEGPGLAAVPLAAGPQTASEWFSVGYAKESAGEYAEAEATYRKALALGGPEARTCFNLANALNAQGQKAAAAERYRQAVEIDPVDADAWNNLATVLEELGKREEALAAYKRSLEVNPQGFEALYNIAELLEQLGRSLEAKQHLENLLCQESVGPYADHARMLLAAAR